ncbi:hypothetical protein PSYAR_28591 [Pseudomonas syringae pv. aceris str. M302273]|nr:hypothetical protein PSYAR_28591 [Pseudomonas syringae pv. aceris str. M302273]
MTAKFNFLVCEQCFFTKHSDIPIVMVVVSVNAVTQGVSVIGSATMTRNKVPECEANKGLKCEG